MCTDSDGNYTTYTSNDYINVFNSVLEKGDIELKTQNRQKTHKTQKDEKLHPQNNR